MRPRFAPRREDVPYSVRRACIGFCTGTAHVFAPALACLLFLVLRNLAESGLLGHRIFWTLYIAVATDVETLRRD
jgi:hypothetical protein